MVVNFLVRFVISLLCFYLQQGLFFLWESWVLSAVKAFLQSGSKFASAKALQVSLVWKQFSC